MGAAWERHAMCESALVVPLCKYYKLPRCIVILYLFPVQLPGKTNSTTQGVACCLLGMFPPICESACFLAALF